VKIFIDMVKFLMSCRRK